MSEVSIRVFHPSWEPGAITAELQLLPEVSWKSGDRRMTPKGRLLDGVRAESYWCHTLEGVATPVEQIMRALQRLEPVAGLLGRIRAEGGRVEVYLWIDPAAGGGEMLSAQLLGRMANLGVDLCLEILPRTPNS